MDTTLVGVTLLSLGMAAALSVIVWRMLRDERARSEARVTALAAMAARPVEAERSSPWGNRFAVMAGIGLIVASVVLFALAASGTKTSARATTAPATTA